MSAFQPNEQLQRANISVMEDCKLVADFIEDACDEGVMKRHLADAYLKAQDRNDEVHVACLDILSSMMQRLNHWRSPDSLREEGLIKQALTSLVDATLGKIANTESDWGTYTMKPHPKSKAKERSLPDYALYNDQVSSDMHIELMTIGVKASKPASNKHEADLVRLGKQMQIIIDKQLLFGIVNPVAVGVLVQGVQVSFYKMKLDGKGLYVLVHISTLHLMRSPSDTPLIPGLLERFMQLKTIIQESVQSLYSATERKQRGDAVCPELESNRKMMMRACSTPVQCQPDRPKKRKRAK